MEWLPTGLIGNVGPWAAFLSLALTVSYLVIKGHLITAAQVDRIVAAYDRASALQNEESARREAAYQVELARNDRLSSQLERMLGYSALGTDALIAMRRVAEESGGGADVRSA